MTPNQALPGTRRKRRTPKAFALGVAPASGAPPTRYLPGAALTYSTKKP